MMHDGIGEKCITRIAGVFQNRHTLFLSCLESYAQTYIHVVTKFTIQLLSCMRRFYGFTSKNERIFER